MLKSKQTVSLLQVHLEVKYFQIFLIYSTQRPFHDAKNNFGANFVQCSMFCKNAQIEVSASPSGNITILEAPHISTL